MAFKVGDIVRVVHGEYQGNSGTVVRLDGDEYIVSFGTHAESYEAFQIVKADDTHRMDTQHTAEG
jgi:transcription elongation factor